MTVAANNTRSETQPQWRLRTSGPSPFGRKIRMALAAIERDGDAVIELADTNDPGDSLRQQNPLGKIPVLLPNDGPPLFDSKVIVDYLDTVDGRHILVPAGSTRHRVLRQQALADGILDAAILQVYESRFRPEEKRHADWLAYQQGKVDRALLSFGEDLPDRGDPSPHIGEIALAAALGYLDFRFQGHWRRSHPQLVDWLFDFAHRFPAYEKTRP